MNDTKMLQTIIDSIAAFRKENNERFDNLESEMSIEFKGIKKRLDVQGAQLSYLEDDAPTREEFEKLEKRIEKSDISN